MSKLSDRISYLQGLAEGLKLNPEKDSNKVLLAVLDVLGEIGESFDALAEAQGELSDYVESIDEDLADLEADVYDDDDEDAYEGDDEDDEEVILYDCPHCGTQIEIDPEDVDFDETALCPNCGKELFPELPDGATEDDADEEAGEDGGEDSGKDQ